MPANRCNTAPEQRQLLEQIRQGEIESCKLLLNCLQHLGVEPNKDTGAFYGKAMAIESLDDRLPFVDKGQQWVIRKLREYLPGCQDPCCALQRMLDIHEENSAASRLTQVASCRPAGTAPAAPPRHSQHTDALLLQKIRHRGSQTGVLQVMPGARDHRFEARISLCSPCAPASKRCRPSAMA